MVDKQTDDRIKVLEQFKSEILRIMELSERINADGSEYIPISLPDGSEYRMLLSGNPNYHDIKIHGSVSGTVDIDWGQFGCHTITATDAITFTNSNTPAAGKGKTITMYVTGDFVLTSASGWIIDVNSDSYDGTKLNRYVLEWISSSEIRVNITVIT